MKAKLGRKTKVCLPVAHEKATWATMRCTSIELCGIGDKISLFLKDWELAKVALSCHMALDMLCLEMHEARSWGDATERPAVTARVLSSHRGRAVTAEEGCGETRFEKEAWLVSVD